MRKDAQAVDSMRGNTRDSLADCIERPDWDSFDSLLEMYHYTNATFLELNGFVEDAIREYREAITMNPLEGFYHYSLGVALLKNDEYNEAYKELAEALHIDPDDCEARCALADVHCAIGQGLETEGRLDEAIAEYSEAISLDPQYPDYHAHKGRAMLESVRNDLGERGAFSPGELDGAARELRTALSYDPCCAEAKLNLGIALVIGGSAGNLEQAIAVLNDVLSADPLNDDARCCLDSARKLRGLIAE